MVVGRAFVLCAVCGCACRALCRRTRILYSSSRRARCAASSAGRLSGCPCLIWGTVRQRVRRCTGLAYIIQRKTGPRPFVRAKAFPKIQKARQRNKHEYHLQSEKSKEPCGKTELWVCPQRKISGIRRRCGRVHSHFQQKKPLHIEKPPPSCFEIRVFVADRGPLQEDEHNIVT